MIFRLIELYTPGLKIITSMELFFGFLLVSTSLIKACQVQVLNFFGVCNNKMLIGHQNLRNRGRLSASMFT